jgi:hypothetical protein
MGTLAQETGVDEVTDEEFRSACNVFGFAPSRALRELLDTATAQAVIAEREACAKECEQVDANPHVVLHHAVVCAAAIRARGRA